MIKMLSFVPLVFALFLWISTHFFQSSILYTNPVIMSTTRVTHGAIDFSASWLVGARNKGSNLPKSYKFFQDYLAREELDQELVKISNYKYSEELRKAVTETTYLRASPSLTQSLRGRTMFKYETVMNTGRLEFSFPFWLLTVLASLFPIGLFFYRRRKQFRGNQ